MRFCCQVNHISIHIYAILQFCKNCTFFLPFFSSQKLNRTNCFKRFCKAVWIWSYLEINIPWNISVHVTRYVRFEYIFFASLVLTLISFSMRINSWRYFILFYIFFCYNSNFIRTTTRELVLFDSKSLNALVVF